MSRRLTGFTPSGELHLGNYHGRDPADRGRASHRGHRDVHLRPARADPRAPPGAVRRRTLEFATLLLAAGADPGALPVHGAVACPAALRVALPAGMRLRIWRGQRMIQFKEKSANRSRSGCPADVSGPDGRGHFALRHARGAGRRGPEPARGARPGRRGPVQQPVRATFTLPQAVNPPVAARMHATSPSRRQDEQVGACTRAHCACWTRRRCCGAR